MLLQVPLPTNGSAHGFDSGCSDEENVVVDVIPHLLEVLQAGNHEPDPTVPFPEEPRTMQHHMDAAELWSQRVQAMKRTDDTVCACCNSYKPAESVQWQSWDDVPNTELLRADVPSTADMPRQAQTVWEHDGVHYLLQSHVDAKCMRAAADGKAEVQLCTDCIRQLNMGRVPRISLVRIDPGLVPYDLPSMTLVEAAIVAPYRVHHLIVILKPPSEIGFCNRQSLADFVHKRALRGHVVAFPNPGPGALAEKMFPCPPGDLPELIQVSDASMHQHV